MKSINSKTVAIMIMIIVATSASAQTTDSLRNLPNLLLPRFTKSIIKFKSGETKTAVLNYNTVDQEMVFMQKKLFLILDNPHLIDTVYMANRKFIPAEKGFLELIVAAPISLFIQHKSYVESLGTPTGYGARSQTTGPSYVRTIYGGTGAIELNIPKNYKVVDDTEYVIRREGTIQRFTTKRQFLKLFPDKEKELDQFIDKRKIDFKNNMMVGELVIYCNELYN